MFVLEYYTNNADLVQTPQDAASDQGPHCLLTEISMENTIKMKKNPQETLKLEMNSSI